MIKFLEPEQELLRKEVVGEEGGLIFRENFPHLHFLPFQSRIYEYSTIAERQFLQEV